jgi:uncharacterized protein (TIRG00374 family)
LDIWRVLSRLAAWQIAVLLALSAATFVLFGARWWVLLRALCCRVPFVHLILHRLAGFGASYFTPGPQVGGEPLLLFLLHRKHDVPVTAGAASVGSDRLMELMVNLIMLVIGLLITLQTQIATGINGLGLLIPIVVLLAFPVVYVVLLWMGHTPLSTQLERLPERIRKLSRLRKLQEGTGKVERQVTDLFHDNPSAVLVALAISLLSWAGMIAEFSLMLLFLGVEVTFQQLISIMTFARIAFLLPSPGGLGALEAGQVLIYKALGLDPVQGLSASLLIRGRDILFALAGLWWANLYGWKRNDNDKDDD